MLYYFAYGSNLHPVRLTERVPSAQLVGVTRVTEYSLLFHKRSHDESSKCNLHYTGVDTDVVYGAIYTIGTMHKNTLDQFEGSGYSDQTIQLHCQGQQYQCLTYIAHPSFIDNDLKPYHWYRDLVLAGARFLEFPEAYISELTNVTSVDDPDHHRKNKHVSLLENCYI